MRDVFKNKKYCHVEKVLGFSSTNTGGRQGSDDEYSPRR